MNGEHVSGGGRKRIPGKQRRKESRQFLGVLDFFRVFLEVKSPVERNVYFKALGIPLLKWPMERVLQCPLLRQRNVRNFDLNMGDKEVQGL